MITYPRINQITFVFSRECMHGQLHLTACSLFLPDMSAQAVAVELYLCYRQYGGLPGSGAPGATSLSWLSSTPSALEKPGGAERKENSWFNNLLQIKLVRR